VLLCDVCLYTEQSRLPGRGAELGANCCTLNMNIHNHAYIHKYVYTDIPVTHIYDIYLRVYAYIRIFMHAYVQFRQPRRGRKRNTHA